MKYFEISALDVKSFIVLPIEQETFDSWKSEHPDCLKEANILGTNYNTVAVDNFFVIELTDDWSEQKIFDNQDHINLIWTSINNK